MIHGCIVRTPLPVGELLVTVSTRLTWHQRTMRALFSDELHAHLLNLGIAERTRVGIDREIVVQARSELVDSWSRLTWRPGAHFPEYTEAEATDPPWDTEN